MTVPLANMPVQQPCNRSQLVAYQSPPLSPHHAGPAAASSFGLSNTGLMAEDEKLGHTTAKPTSSRQKHQSTDPPAFQRRNRSGSLCEAIGLFEDSPKDADIEDPSHDVPKSRWSSTSAESMELFPAAVAEEPPCCECDSTSSTPTKMLRQGSRAERRRATIPNSFQPVQPVQPAEEVYEHAAPPITTKTELRLKIRVYERIDFDEVPLPKSRFKLRDVRDSMRGRISALSTRFSSSEGDLHKRSAGSN